KPVEGEETGDEAQPGYELASRRNEKVGLGGVASPGGLHEEASDIGHPVEPGLPPRLAGLSSGAPELAGARKIQGPRIVGIVEETVYAVIDVFVHGGTVGRDHAVPHRHRLYEGKPNALRRARGEEDVGPLQTGAVLRLICEPGRALYPRVVQLRDPVPVELHSLELRPCDELFDQAP